MSKQLWEMEPMERAKHLLSSSARGGTFRPNRPYKRCEPAAFIRYDDLEKLVEMAEAAQAYHAYEGAVNVEAAERFERALQSLGLLEEPDE